jgi:hypothetical protein
MAECATSPLTDRNPKDHVVFRAPSTGGGPGPDRGPGFRVNLVTRDNTGDGNFMPDAPFPTLRFPSDHAVVSVELELQHESNCS